MSTVDRCRFPLAISPPVTRPLAFVTGPMTFPVSAGRAFGTPFLPRYFLGLDDVYDFSRCRLRHPDGAIVIVEDAFDKLALQQVGLIYE